MPTPSYLLPDFRQALPKDPDDLVLIEGNSRTGVLRYRDPLTGETYTVPNLHYNQQSDVRLKAAKYYWEHSLQHLQRLSNSALPASSIDTRIARRLLAVREGEVKRLEAKVAGGKIRAKEVAFC